MNRQFVTLVICFASVLLTAPSSVRAQPAVDEKPANGNAAPPRIDIAHAPAPLFDDPVRHGAADPSVAWLPGKGGGKGEWWMYYTQRRATLADKKGVDWVHGSAIGIAISSDGLHWKYEACPMNCSCAR